MKRAVFSVKPLNDVLTHSFVSSRVDGKNTNKRKEEKEALNLLSSKEWTG